MMNDLNKFSLRFHTFLANVEEIEIEIGTKKVRVPLIFFKRYVCFLN